MKLICFLGLLAGIEANATPIAFQSSERHTSLLELYTSEGCSSCPPAEEWLSELKTKPGLWSEFVPVAFHVDYWNNPRWNDRFSSAEFTARQQAYAQAWSADTVYTPEFVLDGKEWHDWFGMRGTPGLSSIKTGVLQAGSSDGKHWQVNFVPTKTGATDYEVTAALLASDVGPDVTGGENEGRHLNHNFAALSLITRPLTSQTNGWDGQFIVDLNPKGITGHLALAVWVTRNGHLEPLQATGGWLPQPEKINSSANQPAQIK